MNLEELVRHTLMLVRKDRSPQEIEEFTNEEDGLDIKAFLNDAAAMVYSENWQPLCQEVVTPQDGVLTLDARSVESVETLSGAPLTFEGTREVRVYGAAGPVRVRYRFMPPPMLEDEDQPLFPEFAHSALADYAAYAICSAGERSDARGQQHLARFERKRALLSPNENAPVRFRNKYNR